MKGEIAMSRGLLYDSTLCIGCLECESGCAKANGLPYDDTIAAEKRASEHKFTYLKAVTAADGEEKYMRHLCMHCEEPSCASVCPVGALEKTSAGPVVYDEDKCMGCRYCMVACPFGVPKYQWADLTPAVRKCTGCSERVAKGQPTACSEACPTGATISGERTALIAEAEKRIRENPAGYQPHIFGIEEVGGTSTLFLSSVPFDQFGLKQNLPGEPLPMLTFKVLAKIPNIVTAGVVLLGGIWWISNRRDEVAQVERKRGGDK
jgi:formate dehydrogenase iron-sulfur subunit